MLPLLEAFHRTCHDLAPRPALWSRGEGLRLTFAELAHRVEAWEGALAGLTPLVGLAAGNTAAFVELFFALRGHGVVVVLIDAALPAADKETLCRRLGIPMLLHRDAGGGDGDRPLADGVSLRRFAGVERAQEVAAALPAGTAVVKVTSGSTGDPVGLCLTDEALARGIEQIGAGMAISAADRVLVAIPLSHSYGFDNGVLSLACLGTPLVIEPSYYPAPLLKALGEGEVTFFPAVPPMVRALGEVPWPRDLPLRRVISAGGPLAAEFAARFLDRSGRSVHQFYGSSETGGICFETDPEEAASLGTVGRPLPGVRVELAACGQVVVDSAANYTACLGAAPRDDRRVALSDRAEWSAEGRLRLVGRAADLLNVGGRRISTAALEAALRCLPEVKEAAVVGIADPLRGDRVVAFVVGPPARLAAERLPAGIAPRDLRPIAALPYTARGKLDRAHLRRLAAERP